MMMFSARIMLFGRIHSAMVSATLRSLPIRPLRRLSSLTNIQVFRTQSFNDFLKNGRLYNEKRDFQRRPFSAQENSDKKPFPSNSPPSNCSGLVSPKLTLGQRFKAAYRQYGKVLICVHLVLSCGWFSSCYLVASSGVDVAGLLDKWGLSNQTISSALRSSAGNVAVAYLLYKLISPVRYAMTLGGTHITVRYLRQLGYLQTAARPDVAKKVKCEGIQKMNKK